LMLIDRVLHPGPLAIRSYLRGHVFSVLGVIIY
jgi:hypothetical protein